MDAVPSDSRETAHDVSITLPSRVLPLKLVHSALAAAIVAHAPAAVRRVGVHFA